MKTKKIIFLYLLLQLSILYTSAQSWQPVGSGLNKYVSEFVVYKNQLYATGIFEKNGNGDTLNGLAKFNGSDWERVSISAKGGIGPACVFNNKLILGGEILCSDGKYSNRIASWDGTNWNHLGKGLSSSSWSSEMEVYKNELYVGGAFDSAGGKKVEYIARWNDTLWKDVGGGVRYSGFDPPRVNAFLEYNGFLLVGGLFDWVNSGTLHVDGLVAWDGNQYGKTPGWYGSNLCIFRNRIYSSFGEYLCRMDSTTADYEFAKFSSIKSIEVYNDKLYVGGVGDSIGGIKARNIACWNDTVWEEVGGGVNDYVSAMIVFDSSLYIGGNFTEAGGRPIMRVARLDLSIKPGVKEFIHEKPLVQIIPNPTASEIFLKVPPHEQGLFEILDLTGKKVFSKQVRSSVTIKIEHLPAGLYLYKYSTSSGNASIGKIMKQ
ncbi:MAG: hypothetical protein A3H98_05510 [Bacteroidetes bacterium RIFCSPLOWO2_02_FULL_36_8]|nr:MAG: hypothetical protein A3H98_05510 [Bacteroidetes bacterium RIFCSPLOWO2_02_FULL_36_8]OFY70278.1 MAG: hypothetical protein A3G23_09080 [Bacteroidetes bacterium RIFCSPLOWO2_12_FULL_37_12]